MQGENLSWTTSCHTVWIYLSSSDLKRVLGVNRRFSEVGTERKLWRHFKLFVSERNVAQLGNILRLKILRDLRSIVFLDCVLKTDHLRELHRSGLVLSRSEIKSETHMLLR